MDNKLILPLAFGIFGFIISLLISAISGSSIVSVIIRSLISALVLGGLGYLLVYLMEKFSGESSSKTISESSQSKVDRNKENIYRNVNKVGNGSQDFAESEFSEETVRSNSDLDNALDDDKFKTRLNEEEKDNISYEDLFSKLTKEEGSENSEIIEENENKNSKTFETYKKSVLEEMSQQKDKESIEIDFSNKSEIVEGDSELNPSSISAEDAAKISATSKMSSIAGEVKGIDDKYIYFTKGSKIENKPEKIAKVIKEMLKNE